MMIVYPGLALFLFVIALNLIGDLFERLQKSSAFGSYLGKE
jgi:ABC-type dipeptide/oligopeptide/nickel transport system permease subunit